MEPYGTGEVLEILADSKECWGKFLRVKVRVDVSRPLKRWLRLKLDNSDDIVVVNLKYERLPEFCYVCGKIGHGLRDCPDDDARTSALEGTTSKFGSWLRAVALNRSKPRSRHTESGESSRKNRLESGFVEAGAGQFLAPSMSPPVSKGNCDAGNSDGLKTMTVVGKSAPLGQKNSIGPPALDSMSVDGPCLEPKGDTGVLGRTLTPPLHSPITNPTSAIIPILDQNKIKEDGLCGKYIEMAGVGSSLVKSDVGAENVSQKVKSTNKWKRSARGGQGQWISRKVSSPLHRILSLSQKNRKNTKQNSLSPKQRSPSYKATEVSGQKCKRKVEFLVEEEVKENKKSRSSMDTEMSFISTKPVEQTKLSGSRPGKIKDLLGFASGISVDSIGNSGGLMLL
ncbi:hypothetical protein EZV62_018529 [Acer yangbiense]|uniref:CCHC-type domain-containing protein n=1 Tax=Acer yangbiense TaxID=1000413 RepID=A0A5C7HLR1_9ROSI|nr:hypothetical protein EZV62_018529 [Acer yangbiense]